VAQPCTSNREMVFYGHKTIRAGERLAVWSKDGTLKLVDGPKRITLFRQTKEKCQCVTAGPDCYLQVKNADGTTEHFAGPCTMFKHPIDHLSIVVQQAKVINASEAIVINRVGTRSKDGQTAEAHGVDVRIVRGPARFVPTADEWIAETLTEYSADHDHYLEVHKRDGTIEIVAGPCSTFLDPVADERIVRKAATKIDASEALVIAKQKDSSATDALRSSDVRLSEIGAPTAPSEVSDASVEHRIVRGPARFIPGANEWVQSRLQEYIADENSYMEIRKRAGPIEIIHGPHAMFINPIEDESVRVLSATMIDASEALVIYKHSAGHGGVTRRVMRGPARFIPASDEYLHHFEWSGQPKDGSKTSYQPRALKFDKLKVIPMTAYHNVTEVRTNDDTLITIKLMLFFDLLNIEKMLDATPDPIGDFINAASSDVIAFCSAVSYETFLNETHKLNDLATFSQLVARAEHIGYRMEKVVFRGFQAGEKLQAMHDNAIQERTRLRLLEETQAQEQRAMDLRLAAEQQRMAKEAQLKVEQARLEADISLSAQKAKIEEQRLVDSAEQERARLQHEIAIAELRAKAAAEAEIEAKKLEVENARNEEQLRVLREMNALEVDITKVLVAQQPHVDNVIKLDTGSATADQKAKAPAEPGKGLIGALQLNL